MTKDQQHLDRRRPLQQRGAALLLAMLVLTLVATLAVGMVWQQQRAVQVEAAERARAQAAWILSGALDWARLILREDARNGGSDHLGEPWAVPLAEARLATFLAADRDSNTDDGSMDAFLSGAIVDVQARYNLRNLLDADGKLLPAELQTLQQLCDGAGATQGTAQRISEGWVAVYGARADGAPSQLPLAPQRVEQLSWLGVDAASAAALAPRLTLLPQRTALNLNTAAAPVLMAVIEGLDASSAERLVSTRDRTPFRSIADAQALLSQSLTLDPARVGVTSMHFEVSGRLRLEDRVLEEHSLVERRGQAGGAEVVVLWRERRNPGAAQ